MKMDHIKKKVKRVSITKNPGTKRKNKVLTLTRKHMKKAKKIKAKNRIIHKMKHKTSKTNPIVGIIQMIKT
jgi:hypothetical protein